jgi:signal-transduction protein with cAMP-binding, CBS, and nucleotidyltransferase domain
VKETISSDVDKNQGTISKNLYSKNVPCGQQTLTEQDWQALFMDAKLLKFQKDEKIINQGDPFTGLWLIKEGKVRVESNDSKLAELQAGSIVGEISFIERANANASVVADSEKVFCPK